MVFVSQAQLPESVTFVRFKPAWTSNNAAITPCPFLTHMGHPCGGGRWRRGAAALPASARASPQPPAAPSDAIERPPQARFVAWRRLA